MESTQRSEEESLLHNPETPPHMDPSASTVDYCVHYPPSSIYSAHDMSISSLSGIMMSVEGCHVPRAFPRSGMSKTIGRPRLDPD